MKTNLSKADTASILRNVVLSANDGIITTFAVVAGVQGAELSHTVVIIIGLANVVADGISMATGNYMAIKSENDLVNDGRKRSPHITAFKHAILTFVSFALFGILPLIPYLFRVSNAFWWSIVMVVFSMSIVGITRGYYSKRSMIKTVLETLLVGGLAAGSAYLIGHLLRKYVGTGI